MPKQHVIFGRPVPQISPRRLALLLACLGLFAVFSLLFTLPSAIPTGPNLSQFTDLKSSIPKFTSAASSWKHRLNPFKPPSHPPPRQSNDTNGDVSWYSDWSWLSSPFSSSTTLDENRALLPPLKVRPPIYCYYDTTLAKKKDQKRRNAESAMLLSWRRAWWAQGFKPIILSPAEATNNPTYEVLQRMKLEPELKTDLMKWLAWENMGGGLLAHYLLFPMGAREDSLLAYLRRGEYPALTRWKGLDDGLFAGPKQDVAAAIKRALANPKPDGIKDFITAVSNTASADSKEVFALDDTPNSLAFYDEKTITAKYDKIGELTEERHAEWLTSLNRLIDAHLQVTWQNVFSDGIAVLKPMPEHTTLMVEPATNLANRLAMCLSSPMPTSCPPNRPKCRPCKPNGVKLTTPAKYINTTALYTIGTVPHPYTLQTLASQKSLLDIAWIVRHSRRDAWLETIMEDLVGPGVSSGKRVIRFKEAVAGDFANAHSLWIPAERPLPEDLEWRYGFPLPSGNEGKDEKPAADPEPAARKRDTTPGAAEIHRRADSTEANDKKKQEDMDADLTAGTAGTPAEGARDRKLLEQAKRIRFSKDPADVRIREAIEAWNLADTEAWRFVRAFFARARVERLKWEEEESQYAGGAGSEKGRRENESGAIGRWISGE